MNKKLIKKDLIEKIDLYTKLQTRAITAQKFDIQIVADGAFEAMQQLHYEILKLKEELNNA